MILAGTDQHDLVRTLLQLAVVCGIGAGAAALVIHLLRRRRHPPGRPDGVRRPPRRPAPRTLTGRPPEWSHRPAPGQIWWANTPYVDTPGAKVRPVLVLRTGPRRVDVLKITSQDKSRRRDHIRIPTKRWDPGADHDSWLDLADVFELPDAEFKHQAGGDCDAATWRRVSRAHRTGWWR